MSQPVACRFDSDLGLDVLTRRHVGKAAVDWFRGRNDERNWFICGAGRAGQPLTAELLTNEAGEEYVHIRTSTNEELYGSR